VNLYHLSQDDRRGYDTYSDCVVAAESEDDAKNITPSLYGWPSENWVNGKTWARDPSYVKAKLIGRAASGIKRGVIYSSFHTG
jgi:hypothetical protein